MRKFLFIAYFFPPCAEGGVMRARAFAKHIPKQQWQPIVLTVDEEYYLSHTKDEALVAELHSDIVVCRTGSFEPKGKITDDFKASVYGIENKGMLFEKILKPILRTIYNSVVIPDEHILWFFHAVSQGLKLVKEHKVDAILVTTPPHSAGLIAMIISRLSGKPLIWDVRDDWVDNPLFDKGPWHRHQTTRHLEGLLVKAAARIITVTQESQESFQSRYKSIPSSKFVYIPNGYDQEELGSVLTSSTPSHRQKLRIVYTGTLNKARTPVSLFQALHNLGQKTILEERIVINFYGYTREDYVLLSKEMGLKNVVHFHGFVSREESLRQVLSSDIALMIIPEAEGSRTAIPGKLYEYIGCNKRVLAVCPSTSAAARLVNEEGIGIVVDQKDVAQIEDALLKFLDQHEQGTSHLVDFSKVQKRFERSEHARQLAVILNDLVQL